jgi:aryl-alcohol dehydrogenase-like predicted oxidoreductase
MAGAVPRRRIAPGEDVPVLALGSWNVWDRTTPKDAVALLRRAAEVGATFFDVGNYNLGPHAEGSRTDILFGEYSRQAGLAREDYVLCGKLWLWDYPRTGFAAWMEESLARIGVAAADCVVVGDHVDPVDIRRVVVDVNREIEAGRFRYWGVNNWPVSEAREAIAFAAAEGLIPPTFAQLKYGLARRSMAEGRPYGELFDAGRLTLQASDVFEGGILVGKTQPSRKIGADVGGVREQIIASWPRVESAVRELGVTPAQLGIAFCLTHPATANVLVGVSSVAQLEDGVGALGLVGALGAARLREAAAELWIDREVPPGG